VPSHLKNTHRSRSEPPQAPKRKRVVGL
jgi:hypothetical protein